jgi:hypothetical protein
LSWISIPAATGFSVSFSDGGLGCFVNPFTGTQGTADCVKSYYNGEDLQLVKKYKVKAIVAKQKPSNPKEQPVDFHTERSLHNPEQNFMFGLPLSVSFYLVGTVGFPFPCPRRLSDTVCRTLCFTSRTGVLSKPLDTPIACPWAYQQVLKGNQKD